MSTEDREDRLFRKLVAVGVELNRITRDYRLNDNQAMLMRCAFLAVGAASYEDNFSKRSIRDDTVTCCSVMMDRLRKKYESE